MKIIFDDKEEQDKFIQVISEATCPANIGLIEPPCRCDWTEESSMQNGLCRKCWRQALGGIMEVRDTKRDIAGRTYADGLADAWELAGKMTSNSLNDFSVCDLREIFGTDALAAIFKHHTAEEAMELIEKWKDNKTIHVGDVVIIDGDEKAVVTKAGDDMCYVLWQDGMGNNVSEAQLVKTGQHIDIEGLLKQIGDDKP